MVNSSFIRSSLVVGAVVTNLAAVALIPCGGTDKQPESPEPAATVKSVPSARLAAPDAEVGLRSAVSKGSIDRPAPETNTPWFGEMQRLLAGIPTGKAALRVLEEYDVSVTLEAGQGSYYLPASIVIDSGSGVVAAAVALVHEATHTRYRNEGLIPDPMSVTRDAYVARRIEEEAEGQANAIQAKIELEAMEIDVSGVSQWFEFQYGRAYRMAVQRKRKDPKATEAELKQFGWEMGKNRLIEGFMEGKALASNGKLQYPEIYGREWDALAASKATQAGSGDEAAAAAPKSPTLELDPDPTAEEADDLPNPQVEPEPADVLAFGSIISALAREGLNPLADGLLQLVYSGLSWGRRVSLRGRVAGRLEDLYRASADSEAEVACKAVH